MRIGFIGMTHLGETLMQASRIRGFSIELDEPVGADLVFVTPDVEDHSYLQGVDDCTAHALSQARLHVPIVVVSQVPPGYTRRWLGRAYPHHPLYYQVDTIIMNCALLRATLPERLVVGCADPNEPLHPTYRAWLGAFQCPILTMLYESAELTKLAVNYFLAMQVDTSNQLAAVADLVGADWQEVIPALQLDARIGPKAYLQPGTIAGSHLPRDVQTITKLLMKRAQLLTARVEELRHGANAN